jgi:hypothetical protein
MSRIESMSSLERIDGLVNQNLLEDFKKTVTVMTLDLYAEGFEAPEIVEYLRIIARGVVVSTINAKDKSKNIY